MRSLDDLISECDLHHVISVQLLRRFTLDMRHEPVESLPVIDILNLLERYRYLVLYKR